ncbi:MAG: TetR/AcrR family transcriptional regulator [Hyphomicrobiales bacterium]
MNKIRPTTKDAILEAAFQTFSKTPRASLGDVAKRAGVGRATLHRHFSSREALMVALAHTAVAELNAAVEAATKDAQSHTDGLRRALTAIIPLAERQWFLTHEQLEHDPEIAAAYDADMKELEAEISAAKAEGAFDPELTDRWIAITYENLIYSAWTLVRDGEATPSQAADMAWRTLTRGCGVHK